MKVTKRFIESTMDSHEKLLTSLGKKLKAYLTDDEIDKVFVAVDKFYAVFPEDFTDATRIQSNHEDLKKEYWAKSYSQAHQFSWKVSCDWNNMGKPRINYRKNSLFGYQVLNDVYVELGATDDHTCKFTITIFGDDSESVYEVHNAELQVEYNPREHKIHGSTTPHDSHGQDFWMFFTYKDLKSNAKAWEEIKQSFNSKTRLSDLNEIIEKYGNWFYTFHAMD